MRRILCVLVALVLSLSLMTPYAISAADVRDEFIRTDKAAYEVGEMVELQYEFDAADITRWICIYKESVSVGNMAYVISAASLRASNLFAPVVLTGVNGVSNSALMATGTYIMKVMYLEEGGDSSVPSNFVEGTKSNMTGTFTVQAGGSAVPSIAIADREIGKGGVLYVQFEGIVNTLFERSVSVELRDSNNQVVKSRVLWNTIYYAGKSGELAISLSDVEPGNYKVCLVCSDSAYELGTDSIDITVTEEAAETLASVFPENLFSSADICTQYFANADNKNNTYELIDGEYVMHVPLHPGNDYMYTWDAIPYNKFTVTFDFLLHMVPGSQYSDEMDFLFGLPAAGIPFHQATIAHHAGSLELRHYKHTGTTFEYYEFDTIFIDIYEEEAWIEFTAEITPEEVAIYINGEWYITLEDTAGCVGEFGYIGLRGGSTAGWEIKNLKVAPGTVQEQLSGDVTIETPTETPEVIPTEAPTNDSNPKTPDQNQGSTLEPTEAPGTAKTDSNAMIWIILAITVVVLGGGIGVFIFLRKK